MTTTEPTTHPDTAVANTPRPAIMHALERRGWSQSELARRLERPHSNIGRMLAGSIIPPGGLLERALELLDLRPAIVPASVAGRLIDIDADPATLAQLDAMTPSERGELIRAALALRQM